MIKLTNPIPAYPSALTGPTLNQLHQFRGGTNVQTRTADDDATEVGDLLLPTKYHFLSSNGFNLASGLSLRLPTGDEDDFQGLNDVVLTPYLALSQEWGGSPSTFRLDSTSMPTTPSAAAHATGSA